ncbi:cathepsin L1-like [Poecilia latipinna]|uniref:Cathepsin L1-like n=1 Tax=Poecilia latipinna TaxID=48699 RepID=A0A3B3UQU8_9TELE|nr:PREDICTED: cathepsin L1-like [Poecilia latipinna]
MLHLVVMTFCMSEVLSAPSRDPQLDQHWELWMNRYNKTYHQKEEGWRRMVWEKNLKKIELHNLEHSMGKHSYRQGMNHFADMTKEEFRQIMHGYKPKAELQVGTLFKKSSFLNVPASVDWRTEGYVTPVKDQARCASCWAFSATGCLEGQLFRATRRLVSLSEQNLMDCSRYLGNKGCNGGWAKMAFQYVHENGGLDSEESYPYQAKDNLQCFYNASYNAIFVDGYASIPSGSEEDLMEAVATMGPISVSIDASHDSFQFYQSGVYYEENCSSERLNHGVLLVGYGYSDQDYWIVKNSWSENWGNNGYIHMAKDRNNNCGIATDASFPVIL